MAYKLQYTADGLPFYTEDDNTVGNTQLPTDVSTLQDYAATLPQQQPNPLPTHETYIPTAGQKNLSVLTGGMGTERYQLFPEKIVRSALSLPTDVMSGKLGPYADPYAKGAITDPSGPVQSEGGLLSSLGVKPVGGADPEDELLQRVQDMAALMGGGGVGMAEKGALGTSGGKLTGYHGTKSVFNPSDFTLNKAGVSDPGLVGKAVYLSPSGEQASEFAMSPHYGKGDAPNVMPLNFDMKNPLIIKDGVLPDGRRLTDIHPNGITKDSATAIKKEIVAKGHDGVIFELGGEPVQYAVYNKNSIKSALLKSDNEAAAPIAALEKAPPFYSAVENAVNTASMKSAPAQQWLSTIKQSKGVKPEELDWTGLKDYLSEQNGPVSKQQVQNYLQQNKVGVKEVSKGEQPEITVQQAKEMGEKGLPFHAVEKTNPENVASVTLDNGKLLPYAEKNADKYIFRAGTFEDAVSRKVGTKYSKWQLPGADPNSYKETLLTLPIQKLSAEEAGKNLYEHFVRKGGEQSWEQLDPNTRQHWKERATEQGQGLDYGNIYKSSHWDEPNIIAHIRQNSRNVVGENGQNDIRPASHIEEIQSDWHQKGRESGYKLSKEEEAKLEPEFNRIDDKIVNSGDEQVMGEPHIDTAIKMAVDRKIITQEEANLYRRYSDSQKINAVPDAPFKKTWLDLALKHVIRDAAEKGLDRISWTPGEAQAARYDLSKQIESVHYSGSNLKAYDHNGNTVIDQTGVRKEDLPDIIGKEATEKLLAQPRRGSLQSLVGQELKIGGEGMHYFYDVMVPKALEKLTGEKMKQGFADISKGKPTQYQDFEDYIDASSNKRKAKVNYIDLPQSVKDVALHKGFPLFSSGMMLNPIEGNPPGLTPLKHNPFSQGEPHDDVEVNNKNDVPYLAGASNTPSGLPVNIDRRMPRYDPKLLKPDGQPADLWKYLKIHELNEYHNMKLGMPYEKAHKDKATPAERSAVEADGVNWKEYEAVVDGYLKEIEHEKSKNIPANLYTKPYAHDKSKLNG